MGIEAVAVGLTGLALYASESCWAISDRDLLEGLAWDEGQGIPRQHIPLITRAVTGHTYQDDDITTLLRLAGGHIVEAEQDGWAIYRLYHQRFREHLRSVTRARIANGDLPL